MPVLSRQPTTGRITAWLLPCCLALLVFTNSAFAEAPRPFNARYELLLNRLPVGVQQLSLSKQPNNRFLLETRLVPNRLAKLFHNSTREESSLFYWTGQIISERYQLDRQDNKNQRHAELIFNWNKRQVINDVANERWTMPIPQGTLDKLNVQIAVMQDLTNGNTDFGYQIADGGKLKQYRFEVIAKQTIRTEGGKFETVKIKRIREDQDRTTYLWCAPALDYLPVQIQQTEKDSRHTYLSKLTRHEFLD